MRDLIVPACFSALEGFSITAQKLHGARELKIFRCEKGMLRIAYRPSTSTHSSWCAESFAGPLVEHGVVTLDCWHTLEDIKSRYRVRNWLPTPVHAARLCLSSLSREDKGPLLREMLEALSPHEQLELLSNPNQGENP